MAQNVLLIDGNSIAHANHNATELTVGDMQVQAIFGFLKSLRALMGTQPADTELIVLWDGKAQFRVDIYPAYKGNREDLDDKQRRHREAFKRQTPFIEKALELLGVKQIRSPLLEADDLAGFLAPALAKSGKTVTLVTGDKDWLQLVRPGVSWFDPIRDQWCTHEKFLDVTGYFSTAAFVQGKALQGDHSDNVVGIPKLGEGTARTFMAKWLDVNKFFAEVDAGTYRPAVRKDPNAKSKHPEEVLASPEGRAIFQRNLRLMDLAQSRRPEKGELIIKQPPLNKDGFLLLLEKLNFASILRERDAFIAAITRGRQPLPMAA